MSAYGTELHEVAERLRLPRPVRSRILLELAADLEDLEHALRLDGVPTDEARRRAMETLLPRADALSDLAGLHRPLYRRLVDRFSDPVRHRFERMSLFVSGGGLFLLGVTWLGRLDLLTDPSAFLWPLLGLALAVLVFGAWKGFELFVKRDHGLHQLRRGLWVLPVAAAMATVIAMAGAALDFYALAARLNTDVSSQGVEVLRWLRRDMAMLSIGLLISSIAGVLWLVISVGLARVEQSEAELVARIPDISKGGTG